jgi:glutamyl-tRNA synthetase
MDWGNALVRQKTIDSTGHVVSLEMELNLDGDFRATKKKITWLSRLPAAGGAPLVNVVLLDYDYIITKKKLEDGDNWEDFVPAVSEFRVDALADSNVLDLLYADQRIIQFERKGYYSFDGKDEGGNLMFIRIPDGKAASLASKATKSDPVSIVVPAKPPMYDVASIYEVAPPSPAISSMYAMRSIYDENE